MHTLFKDRECKQTLKVVIIDDDPKIAEFISLSFQIGWPRFKLQHTDTGKQGIELVKKEALDIVLLDIELPDISGFEVLKSIRLFSNVPLIIITVCGEEADVVKGLQLGADDYVIKPFRQLELMARIKAVLRRQQQDMEKLAIRDLVLGQWHIEPSRNMICSDGKEVHLTSTEINLLMHLIRNDGQVVTLKSIAEEIWGEDYPGSHHAIRVYIQRLREKVEPDMSNPSLILNKPGVGYYVEKLRASLIP
jgi:DNA-binding response OmpR family regulator